MGWTIFDPDSARQRQTWEDEDGETVEFRAVLIAPQGTPAAPTSKAYPLAVYFSGLDEKPEVVVEQGKSDWSRLAVEPFLIVAAYKPWGTWWFIDESKDYGWVDGEFHRDVVSRFCNWLEFLAARPFVDERRIGLFGFSAGAYAVVEILSHGCIPLSGVGIAGVHGHGQQDHSDLPPNKVPVAREKFSKFLDRVRSHSGAPWIEATHGTTDQISKWSEAKEIVRCMSERQELLGLPAVHVRELEPEEQDCKPTKKRNKSHHNYFQAAFYRREFLVALLGGPQPPRPVPKQAKLMQEVHYFEWNSGVGHKRKWSWYSPEDHAEIVKSFLANARKGRAEVSISGSAYIFSFDEKLQIDPRSGERWEVRHWSDMVDINDQGKVASLIKDGVFIPPLDADGESPASTTTACAAPLQGKQQDSHDAAKPCDAEPVKEGADAAKGAKQGAPLAEEASGAPADETPKAIPGTAFEALLGSAPVEEPEAEQGQLPGATVADDGAAPAAPGGCVTWPQSLTVEGCADERIGPMLRGPYVLATENHARPAYRKAEPCAIMLYFWDDRDGPQFQGWWFGPAVGGDSVMAFNAQACGVPPTTGWVCPIGGAVDPSLVVRAPAESYT